MSREQAIKILNQEFPGDADLVIEFIQESDWKDGDAYWSSFSPEEIIKSFKIFLEKFN